LTLFSSATTATIGTQIPVVATLPGGGNYTVHLFAGTESGMTRLTVDGVKVTLPIAGTFFEAGSASILTGTANISAAIPNDPSLVGSQIVWYAVIIDTESNRVLAIARCGGPIIEDAIC
jgi:hypothetical protein